MHKFGNIFHNFNASCVFCDSIYMINAGLKFVIQFVDICFEFVIYFWKWLHYSEYLSSEEEESSWEGVIESISCVSLPSFCIKPQQISSHSKSSQPIFKSTCYEQILKCHTTRKPFRHLTNAMMHSHHQIMHQHDFQLMSWVNIKFN